MALRRHSRQAARAAQITARWLADENFNNDIIRGVRRRAPLIDLVRVQDVGLRGTDDETVLRWASEQDRVLLTHDVATLTKHALERITRGERMPGVFEVLRALRCGR
jgi:hypothetical protein